jgi:hemolysin III
MLSIERNLEHEEKLNTLTHGLGAALSIIGVFFLMAPAIINHNFWQILTSGIYGASLILLYLASTIYHGATNTELKKFLKKVDHSCIFLLIAGSYTPFALLVLKGNSGWVLFTTIWSMAVLGIFFKLFFINKFRKVSNLFYLGMGWLCVVYMKEIFVNIPFNGFLLLALGGIFYTIGIIFYIFDKKPYFHPIWHLFVLGGSISHFFSIMLYVNGISLI